MIFYLTSHEEFSIKFSTVSDAPPSVSADPCVFDVPKRHGQTFSLFFNKEKKNIFDLRNIVQYE